MRISSGSRIIDVFLEGGYETDTITALYGPASSGKTLLCLIAAERAVAEGAKIIYIDTEGASVERIKQVSGNCERFLSNVLFLKPTTFQEQKNVFEQLSLHINEKIKLIVVDTISMLYRLEMGKTDDVYGVNRALGHQLGQLNEICRKMQIPVLVTNQVTANMENPSEFRIVGGDILRYGSKCMIELQCLNDGLRKAVLIKHRSIGQKECVFKIVEKGIEKN